MLKSANDRNLKTWVQSQQKFSMHPNGFKQHKNDFLQFVVDYGHFQYSSLRILKPVQCKSVLQ